MKPASHSAARARWQAAGGGWGGSVLAGLPARTGSPGRQRPAPVFPFPSLSSLSSLPSLPSLPSPTFLTALRRLPPLHAAPCRHMPPLPLSFPVHRRTGALVHWCTGARVRRCADAPDGQASGAGPPYGRTKIHRLKGRPSGAALHAFRTRRLFAAPSAPSVPAALSAAGRAKGVSGGYEAGRQPFSERRKPSPRISSVEVTTTKAPGS